jgi:hypothetical protein
MKEVDAAAHANKVFQPSCLQLSTGTFQRGRRRRRHVEYYIDRNLTQSPTAELAYNRPNVFACFLLGARVYEFGRNDFRNDCFGEGTCQRVNRNQKAPTTIDRT